VLTPGTEYVVILNDRQLREDQIRQHTQATHSQRPKAASRSVTVPFTSLLAAGRATFMRLARQTRSAPASSVSP
jgi:hypothetical protein